MPKRVGRRFHICSRHYGKFVLVMAMFGGIAGMLGNWYVWMDCGFGWILIQEIYHVIMWRVN